MATNAEIYGHNDMSDADLEERVAADLLELSDRIGKTKAHEIGNLLWKLMSQIRQAYRTSILINENEGE